MLLNKRIPLRYLISKIKIELIVIFAYAIVIEIMDEVIGVKIFTIPITVVSILGTIISLILSFRIAQAYDRWWEARKIWGAIVNDSRTLIRQALYFTGGDEDFGRSFAKRQIAWCFTLGSSLRKLDPSERLQRYLSDEELEYVNAHNNIPNAILDLHGRHVGEALESGKINPYQQMRMDDILTRLTDSMGMCERIKNTVFPKIYSLFIHFSIWMFIILSPFGYVEKVGWVVGLIVVAVALPFILLEKTATLLQDPFENVPTDTPVMSISETIKVNLLQMVDEKEYDVRDFSHGYYSM